MADRKFISLLMLPAFLLAQLLCICSSASMAHAMPPAISPSSATSQSTSTDSHACCSQQADPTKPSTPVHHAPAHHDAQCPHCGDAGSTPKAERVTPPPADPALSPLLTFVLHESNAALVGVSASQHALQYRVLKPAPPPDLLRVKCMLTI